MPRLAKLPGLNPPALLPALPPHRRAIGEHLFGDPDLCAGLLAEDDEHGRHWGPLILAILQDDVAVFEDFMTTSGHGYTIQRAAVGGLRALAIGGASEEMLTSWAERLRAADLTIYALDDRAIISAEIARVCCHLGHPDLGEPILMEAFVLAEALSRVDQGWTRANALERVGCHAILRSVEALSPGWTSRFNQPRR